MTDLTRQTLIQRLQHSPDERSWEEFSETYSSYITAILRGMNLSHHDIEDLKQQILLKVWKGLPNFKYEPHKHRFRSWLCTVTRNTARTWLTRGKAIKRFLLPSYRKRNIVDEYEQSLTHDPGPEGR